MKSKLLQIWAYIKWPFVVIGAIIVAILGAPFLLSKEFNLGGILGAILGRNKSTKPSIAVANSKPKGRATPIGAPDSNGFAQAPVVPLKVPNNPFRDKDVVTVVHPVTQEKEEIKLPVGVKDHDVESVIVIAPNTAHETVAIKLKDGSTKGQTAMSLEDLIETMQKLKEGKP